MSYCLFCLKFRCHGNGGHWLKKLSDIIRAVVGFRKVVRPCRAEGISCGVLRDLPEKKIGFTRFKKRFYSILIVFGLTTTCQFYKQVPETFACRTQEIYIKVKTKKIRNSCRTHTYFELNTQNDMTN